MKQNSYFICGRWRVEVGSRVIEFVSYFNVILLGQVWYTVIGPVM
jgi:hypothetical protein